MEEEWVCCPEIEQGGHFWLLLWGFLSPCSRRCLHTFIMNHYNFVDNIFEEKTPYIIETVAWSWQLMLGGPTLQTCFLRRDSLRLDRILGEEVQSCFISWCIWDCVLYWRDKVQVGTLKIEYVITNFQKYMCVLKYPQRLPNPLSESVLPSTTLNLLLRCCGNVSKNYINGPWKAYFIYKRKYRYIEGM